MTPHLERAQLLLTQGRIDLAEKEVRQALALDPDSPPAHAILACCLSETHHEDEAIESVRRAIELDPLYPYAFYLMAAIRLDQKKLDDARQAIDQAISLNPTDADHFALLAYIHLAQKEAAPALQAADRGLSQDAQHIECANVRAMALIQLGRTEEAHQSARNAISQNPQNPRSHANQGWVLLHQNKPREALTHFQEALRLDPDYDRARAGLVEALKARYLIYRVLLGYFLWMSRLDSRVQTGLVFGAFIVYQILGAMANKYPALSPWMMPFLILYLCMAGLTWVGVPFFNLLLRLSRFGRYALDREQRISSICFGLSLVAAAVSLIAALITGIDALYTLAIVFALGLLAVPMLFHYWGGKRWKLALALSTVMATGAMVAVAAQAMNNDVLYEDASTVSAVIFIAMMLYTSFASTREN